MHLILILLSLTIGITIRYFPAQTPADLWQRWQQTLTQFLLPPLLLLTMAIAVMAMGMHGQMWGYSVGWLGCHLALGFVATAGLLLLGLATWGVYSTSGYANSMAQLDQILLLHDQVAYLLPIPTLFAAQIGFWRSELVVSQGLLDRLNSDQFNAVLMHEQAHAYFRDPFWFFWLGWLRRLTIWLPKTEVLWQELLLLREMRADRWATRTVDPFLLAESLLLMVQSNIQLSGEGAGKLSQPFSSQPEERSKADLAVMRSDSCCAAVGQADHHPPLERLEERIVALLAEPQQVASTAIEVPPCFAWVKLLIGFIPLTSLLFHC